MKTLGRSLIPLLCLLLATPTLAQWPTNIRENLPLSADSLITRWPVALPYPNGGILAVFMQCGMPAGIVYQIIDRYGQLQFPEPQSFWPALMGQYYAYCNMQAIPDGEGGALIVWMAQDTTAAEFSHYAQRLDSLGNICWGDSASRVWVGHNGSWVVCLDGLGGFYLAGDPYYYVPNSLGLRVQHVGGDGQPLWEDSGRVVTTFLADQREPRIAPDGFGGFYLVWDDHRPPYQYGGALFMQRFDSEGVELWHPAGGRYFSNYSSTIEILPDGQHGLMLHGPTTTLMANNLYRVSPEGDALWMRTNVSYYNSAHMVAGEPGFFYIGFRFGGPTLEACGVYGQRVDLDGRRYWFGQGLNRASAEFDRINFLWTADDIAFAYRYPYFYGAYNFQHYIQGGARTSYLHIQALDSLGIKKFGNRGVLISVLNGGPPEEIAVVHDLNVVADDSGGAAAVWCLESNQQNNFHVFAKHVMADGSLGGPEPPSRAAAPSNLNQSLSVSQNLIRYELPGSGRVSLVLYNLLGQQVAVLEESERVAGSYTVPLNLDHLPSGIYLLQLTTPAGAQTAKVAVVR